VGKIACWSTKTAISLKRVKIEEKLQWTAYKKLSTLFQFFGSLPYFYFRFRLYFRFGLYGHRDSLFCLIFARTAQQSVLDGTNGLSSRKPCVYCWIVRSRVSRGNLCDSTAFLLLLSLILTSSVSDELKSCVWSVLTSQPIVIVCSSVVTDP